MTRLRGSWPVVLLTIFGAFLGLSVLEAGARVAAIREERRQGRLDRDLGGLRTPGKGAVATLGQIIRKSDNPRIVYELRPRLDVVFAGARVTTSDAGYRGRDVASPKPAGAFRIIGIGDSYMFGQGVADDETYLAQLPALMKDSLGGRAVETVNLAEPGFNTVMEVELLKTRAEPLEPDLILIEIVGNDLDLPNFLWKTVDPWTLTRSFLLEFVRGRFRRVATPPTAPEGLTEAPHEVEQGGAATTFSRDQTDVPVQYQPLIGLAPFEQAVGELAKFGRDHHVPVLALTHGVWFENDMTRTLTANAIPVLILRGPLRLRARALGSPDYARSPLAQSPTDLHPSVLGHRAISEELAAWIASAVPRS